MSAGGVTRFAETLGLEVQSGSRQWGSEHAPELGRSVSGRATMSGDEWQNPIADGAMLKDEPQPASPTSLVESIELNRCDLSEDELVDLTYAFQAADMSGEGKLSFEEFCFLLDVMGCDLGPERTRQLMADAKAGFATWLKTTDQRSRARCKKAWDNYDTNQDGTMDLNELNAVVAELRKQGFTPRTLSQEDLAGEGMGFEDFCACVCGHALVSARCPRLLSLPLLQAPQRGLRYAPLS